MQQKLFSIITPTYNCGQKLERTIESVLTQNPELFEYLIVDGASTDETIKVIEQYGNAVRLISERDQGIYDAFNKGIAATTGKYLYFLGAGDRLRPNILAQIKEFIPDSAPTLLYGNIYFCNEDSGYVVDYARFNLRVSNICHQAIFYERTIFALEGRYELKYATFADWALNLKCFANPGIKKKVVPLLVAEYEGGGLSARQRDRAFIYDLPGLLIKHFGLGQYLLYRVDLLRGYLYIGRRNLLRLVKEAGPRSPVRGKQRQACYAVQNGSEQAKPNGPPDLR